MKKITLIIVLLSSGALTAQITQDVIGTSGSTAKGGGGTLNYTIGQVGYTSETNSNGSLNGGFKQAYEISETTGLEETNFSLEVAVYPNPTRDFLTLIVKDLRDSHNYQITDFKGKEIVNGDLSTGLTHLDFSSYVVGIYSIKISTNKNKSIKTFQVIKH